MKAALVLVLAVSFPWTARSVTAQGWVRHVVGRVHYRDITDVPRLYQRPDDPLAGEMWFLVGDDGSLCRVSAPEWVMVEDGAGHRCHWRYSRGPDGAALPCRAARPLIAYARPVPVSA